MKAASDFFWTEEKLNCAQAVLRYFDFPPEKIAEFREFGARRIVRSSVCGENRVE